jgi:hypothetical protein
LCTFLSLYSGINTYETVERVYEYNFWHVHKLFLAYFRKLSWIAYENNLYLIWKSFDFK